MASEAASNDGKLTPTGSRRRESGGRRAACALLLAALLPVTAAAGQWQPTADIAEVAERYLLERLGGERTGTEVRAGMLDGRLRLGVCDAPLEAFLRPGAKIRAKTIVGVRCTGSQPWKIYVPVEIAVQSRVWTAKRPLPKGHLITADDLVEDVRDVSRMTSGYVADSAVLVGQRLRTSILAGRVLTTQLIEANELIERGQTVTLAVSAGGIRIRMAGIALMDGALNQRIRVENLNSGRVVEGIVRSQELVEVLLPGSAPAADARRPAAAVVPDPADSTGAAAAVKSKNAPKDIGATAD